MAERIRIEITGDADSLVAETRRAGGAITGLGRTASAQSRGTAAFNAVLSHNARNLQAVGRWARYAAVGVGGLAAYTGARLVKQGLELNASWESAAAGIATFTGSVQRAERWIERLRKTSAKSPLRLTDYIEAGRQLMGFGVHVKNVIPLLDAVNKAVVATGGGATEMQRVVLALGQIQARGKASAEELNQLAEVGVPVNKILQRELGLTGDQVSNIGEQGVKSGEVLEAIATGWNERYAKAYANAQDTFNFQQAKLHKTFEQNLRLISEPLFEELRDRWLPVLNETAEQIAAIWDREDITPEEKFRRSREVIDRELGPLFDRLERQVARLNLDDKLVQAFNDAIPRIAEGAGQAAVIAVKAFAHGFIQSDELGRAVLLAWALKTFVGGKAIWALVGTRAGAQMAQGVATGMAGGVAGGAAGGGIAGGLAGAFSRAKPFLKRAGAIGLGFAVGDGVLDGIRDRMNARSDDLGEAVGGIANKTGSQVRNSLLALDFSFLGKDIGGAFADGLELTGLFSKGGDAATAAAVKKFVDNFSGRLQQALRQRDLPALEQLVARSMQASRELKELGASDAAVKQLRELAVTAQRAADQVGSIPNAFDAVRNTFSKPLHIRSLLRLIDQLEQLPPAARRTTGAMVLAMVDQLRSKGKLTEAQAKRFTNQIQLSLTGMQKIGTKQARLMVRNMGISFNDLTKLIGGQTTRNLQIVMNALEGLGPGTKMGQLKASIAKSKAIANAGGGYKGGFARGGVMRVPGQGLVDSVPLAVRGMQAVVAPGEDLAVVNRHQRPMLDAAVAEKYGVAGLPGFFRAFDRPHYMARGGITGARGDIGGLDPGVLRLAAILGRQYGMSVTSGLRPGDDGHHGSGSAADFAGGDFARASRYVNSIGAQLLEGIFQPGMFPGVPVSWDSGKRVSPGFWGGEWDNHLDHIHAAIAGGLGALGTVGALRSIQIPRTLVHGPDGAMKSLAQTSLDKVREAAQRFVDKNAGMGGFAGISGGGSPAANRRLGHQMMRAFGFPESQWRYLDHLWRVDESGWDETVANFAGSGAYGIAQALPSSKYPPAGRPGAPDGPEKAKAQIGWGLRYIKERYGSPSAADAFRHSAGWYESGGIVGGFRTGGSKGAQREKKKKAEERKRKQEARRKRRQKNKRDRRRRKIRGGGLAPDLQEKLERSQDQIDRLEEDLDVAERTAGLAISPAGEDLSPEERAAQIAINQKLLSEYRERRNKLNTILKVLGQRLRKVERQIEEARPKRVKQRVKVPVKNKKGKVVGHKWETKWVANPLHPFLSAYKENRSSVIDARSTFSQELGDVQGLTSRSGLIFDTQMAIADLNAPVPADTSSEDSGLADLLRQQLEEERRARALGSAQFKVFDQFFRELAPGLPYLGAFQHGLAEVRTKGLALLHPGESITPAPEGPFGRQAGGSPGGGQPQITLLMSDKAAGLVELIDARIDGKSIEITKRVDSSLGRQGRRLAVAPGRP